MNRVLSENDNAAAPTNANSLNAEQAMRLALGSRPFRWFAQIGSTNDAARAWAAADGTLPQGAVVVADEQTAGRGRFARRWQSPPGSALMFSVVIRHSATHWARLPLLGALAVVETLEALSVSMPNRLPSALIQLKWPNDVQINGRKVAGVLAETEWRGSQPFAAVLGIGLNVRINFDGSELANRAISVEPALAVAVDRFTLLADILRRIDHWTARLADPDLVTAWQSRLVTIGQQVSARSGHTDGSGEVITGLAVGVDPDGALLIQDAQGAIHCLNAGDVTLRDT